MAREEFDKKVKLLNDQAQEYQTERRKWFDNITSKRNAARAEVLKALDPILTEYFETNQISLMLYKRNIAIGISDLDVTSKIIEELDQKLPSIKLN